MESSAQLFPEGLQYSFAEGFGTVKLSETHLLTEKVTTNGDLNPSLVNSRGIFWNTVLDDLDRIDQCLTELNLFEGVENE